MRAAIVALSVLLAAPAPAQQVDPDEEDEEIAGDEPRERGSEITVAFAGGALLPQGPMLAETDTGLDVWGRVGWLTPSGLGLVLHLEYAPLRRAVEGGSPDDVVDAHLFSATAGPRITIGRNVFRLWLAGSAGLMVERVSTTTADLPSQVEVESNFGVSGGGGLDLCFFGSGGLTLAGAYTHALSSGATQRYVSVNAGVVFVY